MKNRRLFSLSSILTLIASSFTLASCGKSKFYLNLDESSLPAGIEGIELFTSSDEKGHYCYEGHEVSIDVRLDIGYTIGSLKLFAGTDEISLSNEMHEEKRIYTGYYTPTESVTLTTTGSPSLVKNSLDVYFNINDYTSSQFEYQPDISGSYIEITNYAELKNAGMTGIIKERYTIEEISKIKGTKLSLGNIPGNMTFDFKLVSDFHSGLSIEPAYVPIEEGSESSNFRYLWSNIKLNENKLVNTYSHSMGDSSGLILNLNKKNYVTLSLRNQEGQQLLIPSSNNIYDVAINDSISNNDNSGEEFSLDIFKADDAKLKWELRFKEIEQSKFDAIASEVKFVIDDKEIPVIPVINSESKTIALNLDKPYTYGYTNSENEDPDKIIDQYVYMYFVKTNLVDLIEAQGLIIDKTN